MRLHTSKKPVPYNTGKVQIGKYYTPPPALPTDNPFHEMSRLQDVLMDWETPAQRRRRRVRPIVIFIVAAIIIFLGVTA